MERLDCIRVRTDHITMAASHEQHMRKALERMNIRTHEVLSDLTGESGLAVIRGILDDMRDPRALLSLCHRQIVDKKAERMLAALQGTWKEEHLFALRQAYKLAQVLHSGFLQGHVALGGVGVEGWADRPAAGPSR